MVRPDEAERRRQFSGLWQNKREAVRVSETFQMQAIHQRFVTGRPSVLIGSLGFTDDALREAEFIPKLPAAPSANGVCLYPTPPKAEPKHKIFLVTISKTTTTNLNALLLSEQTTKPRKNVEILLCKIRQTEASFFFAKDPILAS